MAEKKDYYEVLGVGKNASDAEINSLVTNAATSAPAAMFGASGLGIGLIVGLATGATGRSARKSSL